MATPGYISVNNTVNKIGGPFDQGLYSEQDSPQHLIGEKMEFNDGRVFRYVYTAAAVAAGALVSQDVSATSVIEVDNSATAAAIGATSVILTDSGTLGSATADQYKGALLAITGDDGLGHQYRIKSNTAAATNAVTFTLYDGLAVALTTSSDFAITGGLWWNVRTASATDYIVSGVALIALTINNYGWVQTAGVATILADSVIPLGNNLSLSDGTDGAVQVADAETEPRIGFSAYLSDSAGYVQVVLQGLVA